MAYRIAALITGSGLFAATALAAPTPVTPPPGALIEPPSPPTFSWTLPANERSDALYIADKPDGVVGGMFVEANVVRAHSFIGGESSWSPRAPLYAGHYWWLVSSSDRSTGQRFYSAQSDFRIGLSFEFDRARVARSLSQHWLRLTPHWKGNMHTVRLKVSLVLGGRVIWARSAVRTNRVIGALQAVSFTWHRPHRIKQGTILHVRDEFSVPGASAGAGAGFSVRAP